MNRLEQMKARLKKQALAITKITKEDKKKIKRDIKLKEQIAEKFYLIGILWEMQVDELKKKL